MNQIDPLLIFSATFLISAFAGLATLLRSQKTLYLRSIISAMLNSGLFGLAIGLIWYKYYYTDNIWFLMGISLMAGLGGITIVDFVLEIIKRGGLIISIQQKKDKDGGGTNGH